MLSFPQWHSTSSHARAASLEMQTKKRILFVDDEPLLLDMYRLLFESEEAAWDIAFASGAEEALQLMEQAPFDVVVSELHLSGMTGVDLFREVSKRYPQTSRLVVADQADQEEAASELKVTHQFLSKPFDSNALRSTIWRVCAVENGAIDEKIKALLAQNYSVPSLPSLYFRIMRAMDSPDASLAEIGGIVAQDPGMTAKILQLVNSAFFGIRRRVTNPAEAVQYLGVQKVRSLALSVHVFSCFDQARVGSFNLARVWNHSIATGQIAQKICKSERAGDTAMEEAYVAGMLHDVGKVMLVSGDPARYAQAIALARERCVPLVEAEREIFGVTHAEVGAYLLGLWGLPISIVEAIALHHAPSRTVMKTFSPLTAVHFASWMENQMSQPAIKTVHAEADTEYLARLGLEDRLETWRELAEDNRAVGLAGAA